MINLLYKLLFNFNNQAVTLNDVHLQLLSHTDYPSLKAVTDTLDYYEIDNVAANVPKDALSQLPKVFLALLEDEGETELVLAQQKAHTILLKYEKILNTHREVCTSNHINYTPETFIGDAKYPENNYEYDDIFFFIDKLKKKFKNESKQTLQIT